MTAERRSRAAAEAAGSVQPPKRHWQEPEQRKGEAAAANAIAMAQVYAAQAMERIEAAARKVLAACAEGDMLRTQMTIMRRLFRYEPINTIELRRQIADKVLEAGKYIV